MFRGRKKTSLWLLLPLIVLRGLLPAGSMLGVTASGLSIVVCEDGHVKDASIVAHAGHQHDKSAKGDHSICPFALSAAGGPTPDLPDLGDLDATSVGSAYEDCKIIAGLSGPSRAQQSRAPPSLA